MIDVTKFVKTLDNKPVAVFGLGISNRAAIRALAAAGAQVVAWDDRDESRANIAAENVAVRDLAQEDLGAYSCLVLAPGVMLNHPVAERARAAGLEIMCDLEILHRCGHGRKTIGITGTNGKSTTTALIGHILNECGIKPAVGGNIGRAALDLDMPPESGVFVLEMSSYQLDLCPTFAPDIAVLLNITPDHIDHHGSMENYTAAKKMIFRGGGAAVIAVDSKITRSVAADLKNIPGKRVCCVSTTNEVADGIYIKNHDLYDRMGGRSLWDGIAALLKRGQEEKTYDLDTASTLPGQHNHQNIAAAWAVGRLLGRRSEAIYEAVRTYPGLPHRQQFVREINGVRWINDSKATNADAAGKALASYERIYWIAGGRPKEGGLHGTGQFMDRVSYVFLIGEAQDEFAHWLERHEKSYERCGTLDKAVAAAFKRARPGSIVLFSPACASFDQFRNFEHRGDVFMSLVRDLKDKSA